MLGAGNYPGGMGYTYSYCQRRIFLGPRQCGVAYSYSALQSHSYALLHVRRPMTQSCVARLTLTCRCVWAQNTLLAESSLIAQATQNVADQNTRLDRLWDLLLTIFNFDDRWLSHANEIWSNAFVAALQSASDMGTYISPAEYTNLSTTNVTGYVITDAMQAAFLLRFNNTLTNWQNGIYTVQAATAANVSTDFVPLTVRARTLASMGARRFSRYAGANRL